MKLPIFTFVYSLCSLHVLPWNSPVSSTWGITFIPLVPWKNVSGPWGAQPQTEIIFNRWSPRTAFFAIFLQESPESPKIFRETIWSCRFIIIPWISQLNPSMQLVDDPLTGPTGHYFAHFANANAWPWENPWNQFLEKKTLKPIGTRISFRKGKISRKTPQFREKRHGFQPQIFPKT